jgi:hypothetical protein
MSPIPKFTSFDAMAKAVNCTEPPGAVRLTCLKAVSGDAIHAWANGPQGLPFQPTVDKYVHRCVLLTESVSEEWVL